MSAVVKTSQNPLAVLTRTAALLSRAADRATEVAVVEPERMMSSLALGAQLAATRTLELLPPLGDLPEVGGDDPVLLLVAAERELRSFPPEQYPPGTSHVVVAVCDLIREHRP